MSFTAKKREGGRKENTKNDWKREKERKKERKREAEGVKGQLEPPPVCSHITCFLLRSNLAPFFYQWCAQSDPPPSSLNVKCCSGAPSLQEMMHLLPQLLCFCRIWLQTFFFLFLKKAQRLGFNWWFHLTSRSGIFR